MEDTTIKEKKNYINKARQSIYTMTVTAPLLPQGKLIVFSSTDVCDIHLPHKDALVLTIHIGSAGSLEFWSTAGAVSTSSMAKPSTIRKKFQWWPRQ